VPSAASFGLQVLPCVRYPFYFSRLLRSRRRSFLSDLFRTPPQFLVFFWSPHPPSLLLILSSSLNFSGPEPPFFFVRGRCTSSSPRIGPIKENLPSRQLQIPSLLPVCLGFAPLLSSPGAFSFSPLVFFQPEKVYITSSKEIFRLFPLPFFFSLLPTFIVLFTSFSIKLDYRVFFSYFCEVARYFLDPQQRFFLPGLVPLPPPPLQHTL